MGELTELAFDPLRARLQYGVVDLMRRTAGFTGDENGVFAGETTGSVSPYAYVVRGNLLTGAEVVQEMRVALKPRGATWRIGSSSPSKPAEQKAAIDAAARQTAPTAASWLALTTDILLAVGTF